MFLQFVEELLGFILTSVDNDVYIWKNIEGNWTYYYELLLAYLDSYIVISHEPKKFIIAPGDEFKNKDDKYVPSIWHLALTVRIFM